MMQAEGPPFLTIGTEVSAKYKGAFCEAKVHKVEKVVKIKVTFKLGLGSAVVTDENIKGIIKVGSQVKALHPDKCSFIDAIINKIQDCSRYTVVFDDGDITTLRRTSLCLKSGRHFAQSETLDQLPLTHPEHFGTPVVGGRRGRRSHHRPESDESSDEEENDVRRRHRSRRLEWERDIGKVVCVEIGDKKRQKDNWFPGLVVAPTAQDTVKIETKKDYLVRSFQDGRYYTVPKKEASPFSREIGSKVSHGSLKIAVEKAVQFTTNDVLPPHWDRDLLFGTNISDDESDPNGSDTESSDNEPVEEKDHFVAQLYKYMEECGTPINKGPIIGNKDLDLYKLFMAVQKLGGFNRVMNQNHWNVVSNKMGLQVLGNQAPNLIKAAYKRYLQNFEDFYRKLGCTMVSNPRGSRTRHYSGRSIIRDRDRTPRASKKKNNMESSDSTEEEDRKEDEVKNLSKLEITEDKKIKEEPRVVRSLRRDISHSPLRESIIKVENFTSDSFSFEDKPFDLLKESSMREKSREVMREIIKRERPHNLTMKDRVKIILKDSSTKTITEPIRDVFKTEKSGESLLGEKIQEVINKEQFKEQSIKDKPKDVLTKELDGKREPQTSRSDLKLVKTVEGKTRSSFKKDDSETEEDDNDKNDENDKVRAIEIKAATRSAKYEEESHNKRDSITRSSRQREEIHEKDDTITRSSRCREDIREKYTNKKTSRETSLEKEDMNKKTYFTPTRGSKSKGSATPCYDANDRKSICSKNRIFKTDSSGSSKSSTPPPLESQEELGSKKGSASRGRWKKKAEGDYGPPVGKALIPHHVPIMIGDKLKVLYGPNSKESKVTYEAKVIEVEEEGNAPMYYVHYLGWNTRYDEWIRRPCIAANLTWDLNRAKKGRAAATKEIKEKKEKEKEKREDKLQYSAATSSPKSSMAGSRRGRPSSRVLGERRLSELSDISVTCIGSTSVTATNTTTHTLSKERGSISTDQQTGCSLSPVEQQKTESNKSVQQDTTSSESESYESEGETGSELSSLTANLTEGSGQNNTNSSSSPITFNPELASTKKLIPSIAHASSITNKKDIDRVKDTLNEEKQTQSQNQQCGKDIDLNAIMSEMKGLDKPIKKEEEMNVPIARDPLSPRTSAIAVLLPQVLPSPEKKPLFEAPTEKRMMENMTTPSKKIIESQVSPATPSPNAVISSDHTHGKVPSSFGLVSPIRFESFEDDVYDFKEPEPFDIGEMRTRKIGRKSGGVSGFAGEDSESDSPISAKKRGRPKKEYESDISESESDCGHIPQKVVVYSKEIQENSSKVSPLQQAKIKPSKENAGIEVVSETSLSISEKKNILSSLPGVPIAPIILPVKNEPILKKDPTTDVKLNKFESQLSPGDELVKIETPASSLKTELSTSQSSNMIRPDLLKLSSSKGVILDISSSSSSAKVEYADSVKSETLSLPQPKSVVESAVTSLSQPKVAKLSLKVPVLDVSQNLPTVKEPMRGTTIPLRIKAVSTVDRSSLSSPKAILPLVSSCKKSVVLSERSGPNTPSGSTVEASTKQGELIDSQSRTAPCTPSKSVHLLAQAAPLVQSRAMALAKHKTSYDFKSEKPSQNLKTDEKLLEAKVIPFSQRQQHIFPYLLNRPTELHDKKEMSQNSNVPPINSSSGEISQVGGINSSHIDPKPQLLNNQSVEEEVITPKCNQSPTAADQDDDGKPETPGKGFEQKLKSSARGKEPLSREFVPDTSEDSDTEVKVSRAQVERLIKRINSCGDDNHITAKKFHQNAFELGRKIEAKKLNDVVKEKKEERAISRPPFLSKDDLTLHSSNKISKIEERDEDAEDEQPRVFRNKPRNSATARRMVEETEEGGLGDLLCEEIIPPGSPMPQDATVQEPEESHTTDLGNEMPFASVPTGSSFSKRGSGAANQQGQQLMQQHSPQGISPKAIVPTVTQGEQHNTQSSKIRHQPKLQVHLQHPKSPHQSVELHSSTCSKSSSSNIQVAEASISTKASTGTNVSSSKSSLSGQITASDMSAMPVGIAASERKFVHNNSNLMRGSALNDHRTSPKDPGVPGSLASMDNTPPTTPESIISNISESPQRDIEVSKLDDTSKSGRDSSEMEHQGLLEHSKMDYLFSEDSNTMDNTTCQDSSSFDALSVRRSIPDLQSSNKRPLINNMGTEGEGSEAESAVATFTKPRKRRRGPRSRASNDPDINDDDSNSARKSYGSGNFASRRRKRHSSNKMLMFTRDDGETSALSTLSLVATANSHHSHSRYNFCQELDPDLDATKRITVLQGRIQELKRTYMQVKTELASVERRRKKLRRKEREKEANDEGR